MVRVRIGDDEQHLAWEEWEERVRQGRIPPDALIAIDAITEGRLVRADSLELYRSLRDDATIAWQGRFAQGPPPLMTALLVGVNIRLWWLARVPEAQGWLDGNLTNWAAPIFEDGEPYRLLSMGFLHLAFPHLAMNMLWLAYTGWNLERALGRVNLLVIYLASVLGGSALSMALSPETRSLGASGGVFGLVAAAVVFGFVRSELLPSRGRRVFGLALLPYLVVMFVSGLSNPGIDNWAHFGGLLSGAVAVLVLDPPPLQRRPWWNPLVWLTGTLTASAAAILLFVGGPRLAPLEDVVDARERLQRRAGLPALAPPPEPPYRTLVWQVPAGWRPGVTDSGDSGFRSPSPRGDRVFAVHERAHDAPTDPIRRALAWSAKVRAAMPEAHVDRPQPAELLGLRGLSLRVETASGDVLQWVGITRGIHALEIVWQVDAGRERRLAPLAHRLIERVTWREPEALAEARSTLERNPQSLRAQARLAGVLAEIGEAEEAMRLHRALVAHDPSNADWLEGLLRTATWYPHLAGDLDPILEAALADDPPASVVVLVAQQLEDRGDPTTSAGVLRMAWAARPGDRTLRRALRRRGIPEALDADHSLPRWLVVDPDTGRARAATEIDADLARPLTLAAARAVGTQASARRERWGQQVLDALATDPPRAVDPLLLLRNEAPPTDRAEALADLFEELRTLERRGSVRWLPDELGAAVRASDLLATLAPPAAP